MRRWSDKLFLTFLPTFGNFQRLKETSLILLIIWSIMVISRWLTANKNIECLCKQIYDNRRIYQLSFCLEGTTWWQGLVLVSPLYRSKKSLLLQKCDPVLDYSYVLLHQDVILLCVFVVFIPTELYVWNRYFSFHHLYKVIPELLL